MGIFLFCFYKPLFYTWVKRSTTWIIHPSALQEHAVVLTLKSSPMTWANDVMYFHSIVSMWFVTESVHDQILVTSAAYSRGCRLILAAQHSRTCWTAHRGPAGVLDLLQPLVTQDQCCEMIPDNHAYVSCKNSSTHDWITRKVWKNLILNQIIRVINHFLAIRRQFVGLTDQY